MSDRHGRSNKERFPRRKDEEGRMLCRMCGQRTLDNRHTFCGPRCLRDFFMLTDWSHRSRGGRMGPVQPGAFLSAVQPAKRDTGRKRIRRPQALTGLPRLSGRP